MIFTAIHLKGAYVVEPEKHEDHRGFFARTWCATEFAEHGLNPDLVQCNISFNSKKGTLRGMHYQVPPFEETKLVRCTMGKIFDVIIDMRPASDTFRKHFDVMLDSENRKMLYIPAGFAHGFQTLEDQTEVFYQMSQLYSAEHSRGVRWNDPAFGISWPDPKPILLDRDRDYPDFQG